MLQLKKKKKIDQSKPKMFLTARMLISAVRLCSQAQTLVGLSHDGEPGLFHLCDKISVCAARSTQALKAAAL